MVDDYHPEGETEHYLVEELASIMWRKRRLRLAELAIHHQRQRRVAGWGTTQTLPGAYQPGTISRFDGSPEEEKKRCLAELEEYRSKISEALEILKAAENLKKEDSDAESL
jgi:hypothetical protein